MVQYLTPDRLRKMFLEVERQCWRCKKEIDDLKHLGWSCSKLHEFWKKIHKISVELGIILKLTPESCLLHLYLGKKDCVLPNNLLIASKLLIT